METEYARLFLEPLPIEDAAKIFQAKARVKDNGKVVSVSDEDARKLAESTGCNPQVCLGGMS